MPFTPVPERYNGPELEEEILKFWESEKIFERSLEKNRDGPRFSFNEGPPTANGRPGLHHVFARAFKDFYPRYKTMQGFYAPRRAGWDAHGLPVEHEVEKQIQLFDKREIEQQIGIAEFNRLCRESVMKYIEDWEVLTRRMGYWVNLQDAYFTLSNDYIESVWHLLKRIWDKDLLYRGSKVVPYDPQIGATLSSHEVALGYRDVEDPSIIVRFAAQDAEGDFLVWTTTPWTLPSNLLLAVNPAEVYVRVAADGQRLWLAESRLAGVFGERAYNIEQRLTGSELAGRRYQRLFAGPEIAGDAFRVVAADFVSAGDGTGIVHIAPAYGADDLQLGRREGLPVFHAVDLDGRFKPEFADYAGLFFKDADKPILKELKKRGQLFDNARRVHSYPFGWRTGAPLIYYAKDAWYIRTTAVRDRLVELNQTINWQPAFIRDGRFGNWLENNVDWALSRERFWGTPLPIWTDGAGNYKCVGSRDELSQLCGRSLGDLDLHRPAIDAITFTCEGREYRRVPEVIDCWFDSGAMSYAQWHYPFANKQEFAAHFPADYVCEAIDQTRGWFYTLHAIAVLVDDSIAFRNCVCLNHIVDEQGKKMSKSLGNIIDPYEVFAKFGADPLRWLFLARTAPDVQKRVSENNIREVSGKFINTLWNTYGFFVLYAELDQIDWKQSPPAAERPEMDRWILALAQTAIARATEAMDAYNARDAGVVIEQFVDQLSNWYVRRNRRRFWRTEHGAEKQAAYFTLYECLDIVCRLCAPFVPFLAEALFLNLRRARDNAPQSVHLADWPVADKTLLAPDLVAEMDAVQRVVLLGRSAREQARIRVRQPLARLRVAAPEAAADGIRKHEAQIMDELNVKRIERVDDAGELVQYECAPNFPRLGKRWGKWMPRIKKALAEIDGAALADCFAGGKTYNLVIDGQTIPLEEEDVQFRYHSSAAQTWAAEGGWLVALDTELDEALRLEGLARELVRGVQDARKSAGLEVSDRITLQVSGSERMAQALKAHQAYVCEQVLAVAVVDELADGFTAEQSAADEQWKIALKAVKG